MARRRKRERRLHEQPIVRAVAAILDVGHPTRFAYEGACRHGLRSAMCLEGTPWQRADDQAALIVAFALARIGATRPTWKDGQPEWRDIECHFCRNCGKPVQGERWLFCCNHCSHAASERRRNAMRRDEDEALALAYAAAKANGNWHRTCEQCGDPFEINRDMGKAALRQRYCSRECMLAAKRRDRSRRCDSCGETFRPRKKTSRFCSPKCAYGRRSTDRAGHPAP